MKRAVRHAWQCHTFDVWTFRYQFVDRGDRHMAADHVVIEERQVAALEVVWDTGLAAHYVQIMSRLYSDGKSISRKVFRILFAASTLWILV